MDKIRKAFLVVVGAVAVAFEEANKSFQKASKTIEKQREKLGKRPI